MHSILNASSKDTGRTSLWLKQSPKCMCTYTIYIYVCKHCTIPCMCFIRICTFVQEYIDMYCSDIVIVYMTLKASSKDTSDQRVCRSCSNSATKSDYIWNLLIFVWTERMVTPESRAYWCSWICCTQSSDVECFQGFFFHSFACYVHLCS